MKYLLILLFIFQQAFSQKKDKTEDRENLRNARVGMITNRLNLTSEQAPKFWVIFNDYDEEIKEVRFKIRKLTEDAGSLAASDEKITKNINQIFDLKQKEVDIEKEYYNKFRKVISIRQYAELKRTEKAFNQLLIKRLNRKQGGLMEE
jgi:Spy/CpxP family protein refolding chaperone